MFKLINNKRGFARYHFRSGRLGFIYKKFKSGAGFTLIESTIAILVLVVGLFAVIQLFPFNLKIIGDSQNLTTASNLALSKIEEIRSLTYDNIAIGAIEPKQRVSSDPTSYLYNYQRQTVVETVDGNLTSSGSDLGLKKATVTVFWRSPIGLKEKSIQITTLIVNH